MPVTPFKTDKLYYHGLTKREYLAAQFMAARATHYGESPEYTAMMAVRHADALLAELAK